MLTATFYYLSVGFYNYIIHKLWAGRLATIVGFGVFLAITGFSIVYYFLVFSSAISSK